MIKITEQSLPAPSNFDHAIKAISPGSIISKEEILMNDQRSFQDDKNSNAKKELHRVNDELAMATNWRSAVNNYPGIVNDDLAV